jgi:hypothetical protein
MGPLSGISKVNGLHQKIKSLNQELKDIRHEVKQTQQLDTMKVEERSIHSLFMWLMPDYNAIYPIFFT